MSVVIRTENLGKKYIIGHQKQGSYLTLRDSLSHAGREMWQAIRHPFSPNREKTDVEEFWALKDVDLEIKEGDRVGIIGRNGAGKSTLLKILSRITEPTTGRVSIKGRVASLLEVGTGFHPELTGRENIFLNGAILGMTRHEIRRKFDEIVAFAEVEKFLDTPVKRYSSGMYVRLAFAVAAHLEPEILLVDEVLAVGDAQFQKKCLGKMGEVSSEGRTVLFVSHQLAAIGNLCKKAILLNKGMKEFEGSASQALEIYLKGPCKTIDLLSNANERPGSGNVRISEVTFFNKSGNLAQTFKSHSLMGIKVNYQVYSAVPKPNFKITLYSNLGHQIANFSTRICGYNLAEIRHNGFIECIINNIPLITGTYRINISVSDQNYLVDHVDMAGYFYIEGGDPYRTGLIPEVGNFIIIPEWKWNE